MSNQQQDQEVTPHVALRKLSITNVRAARRVWGEMTAQSLQILRTYTRDFGFSIIAGDLLYLSRGWYVTHSGLIRLARRNHCQGITVRPAREFCDPTRSRWAFEATVYKSESCRGFSGYGDADPSNVSCLVRGAEMRVAETRAVSRALRKAYGIGICSVEEIGSTAEPPIRSAVPKKLPLNRPIGTVVALFAIVFAKSFANIIWIPIWSSPMPPSSVP